MKINFVCLLFNGDFCLKDQGTGCSVFRPIHYTVSPHKILLNDLESTGSGRLSPNATLVEDFESSLSFRLFD